MELTVLLTGSLRKSYHTQPRIRHSRYCSDGHIKHMLNGPFRGIPKEFVERHAALGGGNVPPYSETNYLRDSNAASYVALEMLEESGVKLLLSTYVADPVLESGKVCGVFLENKSGRQAVKAKVVIDDTGEADLARRAGAPVLYPKLEYHKMDPHAPASMGLWFCLGGVDWEKYHAYKKEARKLSEEDLRWEREVLKPFETKFGYRLFDFEGPRYTHIMPLIKKAWKSGEYKIIRTVEGLGPVVIGELEPGPDKGMAQARTFKIIGPDPGNGLHVSRLEAKVRMHIFETARFWKRYVPGFKDSYLLCIAPFLGSRGGPCIEGEYIVTIDDVKAGRRFPDVLYIFDHVGTGGAYQGKWTDFPYRAMLPKGLDGLLAVGRSASCIPDTLLRSRSMVMHMGQAGGIAAALAVTNGVTPKELNVKELQEVLLEEGYCLGNRKRLKELGLA